jgi:hypothetical protein
MPKDDRREDRFTWHRDDVEFIKDPTRPPLLTPEQAEETRANLRRLMAGMSTSATRKPRSRKRSRRRSI